MQLSPMFRIRVIVHMPDVGQGFAEGGIRNAARRGCGRTGIDIRHHMAFVGQVNQGKATLRVGDRAKVDVQLPFGAKRVTKASPNRLAFDRIALATGKLGDSV